VLISNDDKQKRGCGSDCVRNGLEKIVAILCVRKYSEADLYCALRRRANTFIESVAER